MRAAPLPEAALLREAAAAELLALGREALRQALALAGRASPHDDGGDDGKAEA